MKLNVRFALGDEGEARDAGGSGSAVGFLIRLQT
jgi:hypothetical protein